MADETPTQPTSPAHEVISFAQAFVAERSPIILAFVVWVCVSMAAFTTRDDDRGIRWFLVLFAAWATARVLVALQPPNQRGGRRALIEFFLLL